MGTRDSRPETREKILPSSDLGPIFETMARMTIGEVVAMQPKADPGNNTDDYVKLPITNK